MARTSTCQKIPNGYFSLVTPKPQTTTSFDSLADFDLSLTPPDSCDEITPSPVSPSLDWTSSKSRRQDKSEQIFNFGSFDDWMGWDDPDPADNALSPTSNFFPELKEEPTSPKLAFHQYENSISSGINPAKIQEDIPSRFRDASMSEEPMFQSPSSLLTPSLEGPPLNLYSTPLSWSTPTTSVVREPYPRLTPAEEAQLRAIAMPSLANPAVTSSKPQTYAGSPSSSPEPRSRFENRRKRKTSEEDDDGDDMSDGGNIRSGKPVKKTAHNMIEKRYRTNLNDKIAALRDSVPSLRVVSKNGKHSTKEEDLQGLTPAHKLNKATVLSKATEYIAHLEKQNKMLMKENTTLKSRVDAFEILMNNRQPHSQQIPQQPRRAQEPRFNDAFGRLTS